MAGYPRNNLHEQLAIKSTLKTGGSTSGVGLTARSAREQAGLAREMSGIGQYVGSVAVILPAVMLWILMLKRAIAHVNR